VTGFEAIALHNGWVMAGAGALIVFFGLAALAISISLLPRVLALFEGKKGEAVAPSESDTAADAEAPEAALISAEIRDIARPYERLVLQLGEPFQLSALYSLSRELDLPHPHLSLSALQRAGVLVPQGDGAFVWNNESSDA
jgi:hypothetical protein